jgi:hypothetical protein
VTISHSIPHRKCCLILTGDSGFRHRSAADSIGKVLELQHPQEIAASVENTIFEEPASLLLQKVEENYDSTQRIIRVGVVLITRSAIHVPHCAH